MAAALLSIDSDDCIDECADSDESTEEVFIRKNTVKNILNAMANMSDIQKRVFRYRVYDNMSVSETADRLHIPEGSVKSTTHYTI